MPVIPGGGTGPSTIPATTVSASDAPVPLATVARLTESPFADLVRGYSPTALSDLMADATRACEVAVDRRLVPFTTSETHRAQGVDPDEYGADATLPLDLQGTIGRSYAYALGSSALVRHCWLDQFAPRMPEYWAYSGVAISLVRSYGGSQNVNIAGVQGPELDSGHVWFSLGTFLPVGSLLRITYSGGYSTIPADLVRACIYMAASIAAHELDPMTATSGHDADTLHIKAMELLSSYTRV